MKVLIVGASGFLGTKMLKVLGQKFDVYGTYASRKKEGLTYLDVTDVEQVTDTISEHGPDVTIYAGGLTNVDSCQVDKDVAWKFNVTGTTNLVDACKKSKFIYISTDFVFDGLHGNYSERDEPNPVNYYGRTKFEGEKIAKQLPDHLTLRVARLYGYNGKGDKTNFVRFVVDSLRAKKPVKAVSDQYGCPTLIDDIAAAAAELIKKDKKGIYHCCGSERTSMYDFARTVADVFKLNAGLITPITTNELEQVAKRPTDASLNISKLNKTGIKMSDVRTGLLKMREAMG